MSAKSSDFVDITTPVLAVDSAMCGCVAGVFFPQNNTGVERSIRTDREQAAKLVPLVQDALSEAGVKFSDLGLIVTTRGPGSFTGLRIGMSAARSFSLALGLPLQGVTTFEAVFRSVVDQKERNKGRGYLVVLETKRRDFYVQRFSADFPSESPVCLDAPDILALAREQDLVLCGDGIKRLRTEVGGFADDLFHDVLDCTLPSALALARAGLEIFTRNKGVLEKAEPLYMRGADVSTSTKLQRKIADFPDI